MRGVLEGQLVVASGQRRDGLRDCAGRGAVEIDRLHAVGGLPEAAHVVDRVAADRPADKASADCRAGGQRVVLAGVLQRRGRGDSKLPLTTTLVVCAAAGAAGMATATKTEAPNMSALRALRQSRPNR